MALFLKIIGFGWALIGVANFCSLVTNNPNVSDTTAGFSVIFQALLFVFPGLTLAGIGAIIAKKQAG